MSEIVPGTTDAAVEKHVPVWTVENGIVHVKGGSVEHPMLPEHYIEWVSLQTKQGNQRKDCLLYTSQLPMKTVKSFSTSVTPSSSSFMLSLIHI